MTIHVQAINGATFLHRNLTLSENDIAQLDQLQPRFEASSGSEVVRETLRFLTELIEDRALGKRFLVVPINREAYEVNPETLKEGMAPDANLVTRNLLIHETSAQRLDLLKELGRIESDSQAIQMSVRFCNILITEIDDRSKFYIIDGDVKLPIRIAGLMPVRPEDSGRQDQSFENMDL